LPFFRDYKDKGFEELGRKKRWYEKACPIYRTKILHCQVLRDPIYGPVPVPSEKQVPAAVKVLGASPFPGS
jgi:hypothetical protein